jgi:hypothetical protein
LAAAAFGFVLALGMDVAPFSTLVANPVHRKRVVQMEAIVFDPGDVRVLAVELFFVVEGVHEVLNIMNLRVAVLNECTDVLLLVSEGSLLLVFGSCDMLRSNGTYTAWVTSGHGGVAVNADADAGVVAQEGRRGAEGIDGGI